MIFCPSRRLPLPLATVLLLCIALPHARAQKPGDADLWLTTPDRTALLAHQPVPLHFGKPADQATVIEIDSRQRFQRMDGFGFALTGGSAELLMRMSPASRTALLQELFRPVRSRSADEKGIGVSYLRVTVGASDMNERVFTYDDLPAGEADPEMRHFNLGPDRADVVPVLKEILAINPNLTLLASPWSPPSWMKTNGLPKGGSLKPELYGSYALYLVKYLQAMAAEGIHINALTVQNEPLNPKNTPSLLMTAPEEGTFIKTALGPALQAAGLHTAIFLYDHNCDKPEYPLSILADPADRALVAGSAFHLYGGEASAMTSVHDAYPEKGVYFTEQMVISKVDAPLPIAEPVSRVVIGATTNWAQNVLLWNLAADPANGPHTADGGCPICQGAVTLDGDQVTRNLAFYTIAHISRFVPPGSFRIASTARASATLAEVAFRTPDGRTVLLVANKATDPATFAVRVGHGQFTSTLAAGAVGTFVWP